MKKRPKIIQVRWQNNSEDEPNTFLFVDHIESITECDVSGCGALILMASGRGYSVKETPDQLLQAILQKSERE